MQDKELKRITIVIAGRSYPVKVTNEEALKMPGIEKKINDQIRQIQMSYKDRDIQDCLSMVLLQNSLQADFKETSLIDNAVADKLDDINSQLKAVL